MTRQQLLNEAKTLPREDQIELARDLWEIIDLDENDFPLTDEQKAELDRRIAEADADPTAAEDWESLKTKLLQGEF
jgi:putative addiction module component (TIGR02574 family)